MKSATPQVSTSLLAITACVLWSTAFVGVKVGLKYATPLSLAGMRFFIAGLILLPLWRGIPRGIRQIGKNLRFVLLVSLFQTVIVYSAFFTAMTFIDGALGAILMGASPVITAIVSHLMLKDDKMSRRSAISLIVGLLGIVVISVSREPWSPAGLREFMGVLLILFAIICSAVVNVFIKRNTRGPDPVVLSSIQMLLGGLVLLLISLPIEGVPDVTQPGVFYLAVFWLAFISAVGFSIWFVLLKRVEVQVSTLNAWMFIIPVFGAVFSWIILPEESPSLFSVLGMALVAISLVSYNLVKKRSPAV